MDLLLWRHAEALDASEDQPDDMLRPLSPRGIKQAQRMATWLDQHMPDGMRILSSPALRCESTAAALGRKYKLCNALSPDGDVQAVIELAQWPDARTPVLIVGHQPMLGQLAAQLLGLPAQALSVRKGSVWWLRNRVRLDAQSTLVHCVQSPDMLW
jgi:phosphohistidine phosphatase